jgi:predicted TIM-barrel fold metal-dependent hydrolase
VQTNWAKERFEDEAAWVQRTADEHGFPHAIVAYADMDADDVRPQLDRLARHKLLRGVRMQLHWHDNPLYRFAARPDLCADARIRANIARLADYGFSFDLQVFSSQMAGAVALAENCPAVTFILQHAGMPEDLSPAGREAWRAGMQRLAACPNVVCKLSGLGTFIHRNDPAHIAGIANETIAMFGAARCLFGSNFPIEKLWTGYRDLVAAYRSALAGLGESERDAVLRTNAMRVYRLAQDMPAAAM